MIRHRDGSPFFLPEDIFKLLFYFLSYAINDFILWVTHPSTETFPCHLYPCQQNYYICKNIFAYPFSLNFGIAERPYFMICGLCSINPLLMKRQVTSTLSFSFAFLYRTRHRFSLCLFFALQFLGSESLFYTKT